MKIQSAAWIRIHDPGGQLRFRGGLSLLRITLVTVLMAALTSAIGCSSSSSSANNPKLVNPPDPKLKAASPTAGGGKPKASSQ
jgi:hypothetical protein